jgi:hypothetical protein
MNENLEERIERLEKKVENLEERVKYLETITEQVNLSQPKSESVRRKSLVEFIKEKNPKSWSDITLCIGYYLQYFENYDSFTSEDIKKGYKRIYKPLPKNLTDTIRKNVLRGSMERTEGGKNGKKSWYVTEKGKERVEKMGEAKVSEKF